jgi:hypothetical protein
MPCQRDQQIVAARVAVSPGEALGKDVMRHDA